MSHFLKGAQALKVKEVPSYVSGYAKEHLTYSKVEPRVKNFFQARDTTYFQGARVLCVSPSAHCAGSQSRVYNPT